MAAINVAGRAVGLEPLQELEDTVARDLYERHARRVLAYCRSRLRRREDAEDAVQTTFLHAVDNLRRGDTPSHELAWLLGIARNVCLSRLETAGRRGRLELVCDPADLERSEAPNGRRDELIGLEQALARLPEQQRRAVLLRDWRGLSYEEVASQLGVSLANAETLIFRGRRSLATLLDEQPAATRRRLASLGNTGSLLAWAKASFGGAAAASKLAAAVAVVAVSGVGVAAGTGVLDREPKAQPPTRAELPVVPAVAVPSAPPPSAGRGAPHVQQRPRDTVPQASKAPPAAADRPVDPAPAAGRPQGETPTAPTGGDTAPQAVPSAGATPPKTKEPAPAPTRVVGSTVESVSDTVEQAVPPLAPALDDVTETVVEVVESLPVPELPVETPPVVETVVEAVPTVTVGPVTVDPPKLLPRP